jgi:hypothetical protein
VKKENVKRSSAGAVAAFVLFLYDCARLGLVLGLVKDSSGIPLASANALFPVAGFFLIAGPQKYREYGPLYVAGKTIAVFAGLVWLFFAIRTGSHFPLSPLVKANYTVFSLVVLTFADMLSIPVRLLIREGASNRRSAPLMDSVEPVESIEPVEPFQSKGDIA